MQLIRMMAQATGRNFILGDDIKGSVTVIAHKPLTVPEAYEAFLSILEVSGYTTVAVGANTKIVPTSGAANSPLRVGEGDKIPFTDNFVTQIIQLENVAATDISGFVKDLSGKSANGICNQYIDYHRFWRQCSSRIISSISLMLQRRNQTRIIPLPCNRFRGGTSHQ